MRRRLAEGLAVVLSVASLGAGAASGPNSSEAARVKPQVLRASSQKSTKKTHKSKPYQVGTASWYGQQFQGKETASGEPFDMRDFTAAHPSLPLGTFVKITNLRNGRAVVVRINDRGPVVEGRIIDVSYNAARALGFREHGLQQVRLDLIPARHRGDVAAGSQPPLNPIHSAAVQDPRHRLIVALDISSAAAARKIVAAVGESALFYKVGMQLYTAEGPAVVRELVASGRRVFLDLKYHDIPNTVCAAVREAAQLGASMLTIHAAGGSKMVRAACDAAADQPTSPLVLAVTVLTSLDDSDLNKVGVRGNVVDQALRLAALALSNGCKGVVASAWEASALREELGHDFVIVTPGVRPAGSGHGDQVRVVTPSEAIAAGATHIVVGRPITAAEDPAAEARAILGQIG